MPIVEIDGQRVQFPDNMPPSVIADTLTELKNQALFIAEPAAMIASATAAEPVAGWGGIFTQDGEVVHDIQNKLTYQPKTEAGQAGTQRLMEMMQTVVKEVGLEHAPGYWRDRVIPALQDVAGTKLGSALGAGTLGMAAIAGAGKSPKIRAYHGSPHGFDKFDMSKIGTGEGAQAKGYGLYFAEVEDTAKEYKSRLSNSLRDSSGAVVPINETDTFEVLARDELISKGNYTDAIESLNRKKDAGLSESLYGGGEAQEVLRKWESEGLKPEGHMYQVDIDANLDEFLDWDKPLSEQSHLLESFYKSKPEWGDWRAKNTQSLLENIDKSRVHDLGYKGKHRDVLLEHGIKGIRYKDQFSRGKEGGTSNYVIFDPEIIEISKKYGVAVPIAAMAAGKEDQYKQID